MRSIHLTLAVLCGLGLIGALAGCCSRSIVYRNAPNYSGAPYYQESPYYEGTPYYKSTQGTGEVPAVADAVELLVLPPGVERGVVRALAADLERRIADQGGLRRDVARPYTQQFRLKVDGLAAYLAWEYESHGDYDQNGLVEPADLIPLAQYLGEEVRSQAWQQARVADGDGDGRVNLDDLAPLAWNYGRLNDNFVIRQNFDRSGAAAALANVALSSGVIPPGGGRLRFEYALFPPDARLLRASYFTVVNGPPQSVDAFPTWPESRWNTWITLDQASGPAPLRVTCAVHLTGTSGQYGIELDFGDGTPLVQRAGFAGGVAYASHTYAFPGRYSVTARTFSELSGSSVIASAGVIVTGPLVIKQTTPR